MEEVDDAELVVERIAALDLGKAGLEACVRVPHTHRPGRRMQELRGYATTTAQLLEMAAWFRHWRVQRVVMESTSSYWKGVYYLLEAQGFECWLVNAREVKNVPGRAKTDRADAVWPAKVAERGMCRPSLVQPPEIRRLRDLTRYRRALVQDRTREQQRVEKLLEDAQIKISSVLSNVHGVSGRAMMEALIAGQRDPRTLAKLAKAGARKKTEALEEALRGFFTDHHATILQMMLDNTDRISAQIATLDARIAEAISPFSDQAGRLTDIPGVDAVTVAELIAEIGVDMTRFPSAAHLVSWAKFCPQTHQSAGKSKAKGREKGNPLAGRHAGAHRLRQLAFAELPGHSLPSPGPSPRQAEGHRCHRQLGADDRLPSALRPRHQVHRSGTRLLRIPDQQTPSRPRSGQPTPNAHRPAHRYPRRQSRHHRSCRLTPNPPQHNMTRLRRVPSACPLTIRFSGQTALAGYDTLMGQV